MKLKSIRERDVRRREIIVLREPIEDDEASDWRMFTPGEPPSHEGYPTLWGFPIVDVPDSRVRTWIPSIRSN